jgi:hypothetical protein
VLLLISFCQLRRDLERRQIKSALKAAFGHFN